LNFEWQDAEQVIAELRGAQIEEVQLEGNQGLHVRFLDDRVLVIVGIPALGVAIIRPERNIH
jgi:hypothetical protein